VLLVLSAVGAPVFTNSSFETGTPGSVPPGWTVNSFQNTVGVTIVNPQTVDGLNLQPGGVVATFILNSAAGPLSQPDPFLGDAASLRWPKYGRQAVIVNANSSDSFGHGRNANSVSQVMTIGAGDVDAADGKVHISASCLRPCSRTRITPLLSSLTISSSSPTSHGPGSCTRTSAPLRKRVRVRRRPGSR
jgi:hypothetical protein